MGQPMRSALVFPKGVGMKGSLNLDRERGSFKIFALIYSLYLRKFARFAARLLKKRVKGSLTLGIKIAQKP